jgi:hypothetical protein
MFRMGDSTLPFPQPDAAYREACRRANERFRVVGKEGSVLLELRISERGEVIGARAIDPAPLPGQVTTRAVTRDSDGNRLPSPPARTHDPEIRRTAEEVVRLLRFRPAERNGQPMETTGFRMTISFG